MNADLLVRAIAGRLAGSVAADGGTLAAYSTDASNHRLVPVCVVFPRGVDDVVATVDLCRAEGIPVTSRGAGTNLAGNAIGSGVVLDYSRHFNRIVNVDADSRQAVVEPGVVLDDLQAEAARFGLRFGPDPATHSRCTIGGMIGTNACGARAIAWGTTSENVRAVDLVLSDGSTTTLGDGSDVALETHLRELRDRHADEIGRELGRFSRQVSGYGLHYLLDDHGFATAKAFVGSEGTCGLVTSATLDLVELPARRGLLVAGFDDIVAAAAAAPAFAEIGPLTTEGMDDDLLRAYDGRDVPHEGRPTLPLGGAWLLVEVGGSADECAGLLRQAQEAARSSGAVESRIVEDRAEQAGLWQIREQGAGLTSRPPDGSERWPGWEDAAVPPDRLASYLTEFRELLATHGRSGSIYGHFGEGCVHVRIDHDLLTESGRGEYRRFQEEAADLVVAHHGSLSGEHGDGRARSELLPRMYSPPVLQAFAEFKEIFDQPNLLNPGLIVDPSPLDADLRVAVSLPHTTDLAFTFAEDGRDFAKAARRCGGVGACRAAGGGMCPSYQATKDERHSTRGRARILFEMLDGHLADDGWRSRDVKDALDLCLMCKACSSECPVSVDMATYKAEFLHHHYRHRPRPRAHLSMGWLPLWLALGRRSPRLGNAMLSNRLAARIVKRLGGIDARRELPEVATDALRRGVVAAPTPAAKVTTSRGPVVLWLDTFTASFAPEVVTDAISVLSAAGFEVEVAGARLCCGLTWLSTGQLRVARRIMTRTVKALDQGDAAIIVLEPSCAAALRDDAVKLLDTDAARRVARRIRSLAEVAADVDLPLTSDESSPADGGNRVIAQFHCHQRATSGTAADRELLARLGYDVTSVDEGCCGLAGNFGFEDGHFDVSSTCAEQSFMPYLNRDREATVLADGFSCRLQMEQLGNTALAGRSPLHLATLLARHLH